MIISVCPVGCISYVRTYAVDDYNILLIVSPRRSQEVQSVHLHPQGGEKNSGVIYRENL